MTNIRNALMQAAGTLASGGGTYVEDVFSTHLYDGISGTSLSVNNGIDLAGEGGLVWIKERSNGGGSHKLLSTDASGNHSGLLDSSNANAAGTGYQPSYFTQNNNGFTTTNTVGDSKTDGNEYASWSFRVQEGFFDVVQYTGNGSSGPSGVGQSLFTSSGTFTVPSGVTKMAVLCVGGGGSGGWDSGGSSTGYVTGGGGGGGGALAWANINCTAGQTFAVTVGSGGSTGYNQDGSAGGNSSVVRNSDSLNICTANGGSGGGRQSGLGGNGSGGAGGTRSYGSHSDILATGGGNGGNGGSGSRGYEFPDYYYYQGAGGGAGGYSGNGGYGASGGGGTGGSGAGGGGAGGSTTTSGNAFNGGGVGQYGEGTSGSGVSGDDGNGGSGGAQGASSGGAYGGGGKSNAGSGGAGYVRIVYTTDTSNTPEFPSTNVYDYTVSNVLSHNLGSVPRMMLVKCTSNSGEWFVYHESLGATKFLRLHDTHAAEAYTGAFNNVAPTSSVFTVGSDSAINFSGRTYIAYLFGDEASFGDDEDEKILKTGSFSHTSGTPTFVNCGFEAGWVMVKRTDSTDSWWMADDMRGFTPNGISSYSAYLAANTSAAEGTSDWIAPNARGFDFNYLTGSYVYIAIRRGPMKEPSAGTDVYNYQTRGGGGTGPPAYIFPHPVDWFFQRELGQSDDWYSGSRMIGPHVIKPDETDALASQTFLGAFDYQNGFGAGTGTASAQIAYAWRRYPKVFDIVFYEGTGSTRTVTHNLGVAPEMMIIKNVEQTYHWEVYHSAISPADGLYLSDTGAASGASFAYASTQPTASVFTVGSGAGVNSNTKDHIAFLFASLNGISKVGTYTGTGSAINIDCGFSGGARWVMVKRKDADADWYIVSSGRGFGKHLKIDSDADESSTAVLDTLSAGFTVRSDAGNDLNANGGTYIYLAFA